MPKKAKRQEKNPPTWVQSCPPDTEELQESALFKGSIVSNPLLVFEIFNHLSDSVLLSSSLVCKQWNAVSREILRRHRRTFLNLSSIDGISSLESLIKLIDSPILGNNHPFRGVKFNFSDDHFHIFNKKFKATQKNKEKTFQLLTEIFQKIQVKNITLNFSQVNWINEEMVFKTFFLLIPVERIEFFKTEGISLDWTTVLELLGGKQFLNLKHLDTCQFHLEKPSHLRMVLDVCPSMTEWFMPVFPGHVRDFVDTNRASMIKKLDICGNISSEEAHLIEEVSPILRELEISNKFKHYGSAYIQNISRIIAANVQSLEVFHFHFLGAFEAFIHTEEFPSLVNVRTIYITDRSFFKSDHVDEIISNPGYGRIFPNVKLPWLMSRS
ncbi:unnamed protein product [Allacma fusca]|uniref:F-box domain-containing protein n=1 Tax=Allacma fusca TaxID=39272 RepID=A0A8J2L0B6_9HEXA|nr:unnamed protein product [Allacma fusca]